MSYLIKVLDEHNHPVDAVEFVDNLTIPDAPAYRNCNGRMGLTRCKSEKYYNQLVLCFFYKEHQDQSYAEFISDKDAYNLCAKRNKLDVAADLKINFIKDVEVY